MAWEDYINKWKTAGDSRNCWNCVHCYHIYPETKPELPPDIEPNRFTSCLRHSQGENEIMTTVLFGQYGPITFVDGTLEWCSAYRKNQEGNIPPVPPLAP